MKKELKLNVTPIGPDFQNVRISNHTQSHRGKDFGNSSDSFYASNGVILASNYNSPGQYGNVVYVRGHYREFDNREFTVSVSSFQKIKVAVEEYNKVNSFTPKAPAVPQHLKVSAQPVGPDFQKVKVTVLSQSHARADFGTETLKGCGEFVYGGIRLCSSSQDNVGMGTYVPSRLKHLGLMGTFYVARGEQFSSTLTSEVTVAQWSAIKTAVEAYNRQFAAPKAPAAPEVCSCVVG